MVAAIAFITALLPAGRVSGQDQLSSRPAAPRVGDSHVSAPTLLHKVEPQYSAEAERAGIEGTVFLYGEVGPDGLAHNLRVVRSIGHGLDEEAIEAVAKWRFRPGEKDGKPVTVAANFEVNFRLHGPVPKELADESSAYLRKRLRVWRAKDAEAVLGRKALSHRAAVDEHGTAYGEILTYSDPTNKYEKFDLTFDAASKKLREVRVYPWNLTLDQFKAIWGDKFEVERRPDGLSLYIFRDQRTSVLARDSGEVVSFNTTW